MPKILQTEILVRWRFANSESWEEKTFPLDRLEEVLQRAWLRFGNPEITLNTSASSGSGYVPIPKPRRRNTKRR